MKPTNEQLNERANGTEARLTISKHAIAIHLFHFHFEMGI